MMIASSVTYDAYNNVLTSTTPGRTVTTNEDWGDTEEEKRKHLLRRSTSPLGRVSAYQYDAYGNRTQSKLSASAAGTAEALKSTMVDLLIAYRSDWFYDIISAR